MTAAALAPPGSLDRKFDGVLFRSRSPNQQAPYPEMLSTVTDAMSDAAVVVTGVSPKTQIDFNVLQIVNGEHFSGAERMQSHLGRCLPQFGVAADFACVKPGKFAQMIDDQSGKWGRGFHTPMRNRFDLGAALRIRELLRGHRYDLMHAHTPRTAMIASIVSTLTGVPWVYHVHSPASRDSANGFSNHVNAFIEKRALSGCAHLITVSESLRGDCIARGIDQHRVTVVHNGVPAIRPEREELPVPGAQWTIGMVALMRPRKGLEIVLRAIADLEQQGHDVVLRCIGPFETETYQSEINDLIRSLNIEARVQHVGFTEDVPKALARLDAMVLPSLFGEGLPMVVLEAMAAALPVIATRVERTPEAITHGVEGLLAEPGDPVSLAAQIRSLVTGQHDWIQMSETGCKRHARCFSDLTMASDISKVYRDLL